jgi:hypothetical protein
MEIDVLCVAFLFLLLCDFLFRNGGWSLGYMCSGAKRV